MIIGQIQWAKYNFCFFFLFELTQPKFEMIEPA